MANLDTASAAPDARAASTPDRRQRVLVAARTSILRLGYDKAGLRDIAAEAGLSKSAIYLDFASKEALVDELIRSESVAFATELFDAADGDAAGFGPLLTHTLALLRDHPFLRSLLAGDEGLLGAYVRRHRGRFLAARTALNASFLELLRRDGRLRPGVDLDAAAPLLMMLTIGYVETPSTVAGDRAGAVLEEMGRMLDAWLLRDDATTFAPGELPGLLHEVLATTADREPERPS